MQKTMNAPHFISLACFLLLSCAAAQTQVLDSSGQELVTGVQYYISSIFWGAGGGDLSLRNGTCPLPVIQLQSDRIPGIPVTFHRPTGSDTQTVNLRANLDVQFASNLCDGSTVWTVGIDPLTRRPAVRTGGELGFHRDPDFWFQIHESGSFYRLAYCYACEFCRMAPQCTDLSIVWDGRSRRLAVAMSSDDPPFSASFRNANTPHLRTATS